MLSSPVVLGVAAVAALAYGGYKFYKYVTRNDSDEYSKLRLYQYGFKDKEGYDKEYNAKVFSLEQYLWDGKIGFSNGEPYVNKNTVNTEEVLKIMQIDNGDTEAIENFSTWYTKRFKPFFLTHVAALYAADNKAKFDDIPKLDPEKKLKYLEACGYPSGPYDVDISPFKKLDALNVDPEFAKNHLANLIEKVKKEVKEVKDKKPELEAKKSLAPPKPDIEAPAIKPPEASESTKADSDAFLKELQGGGGEEPSSPAVPGANPEGQKTLPTGRLSMADGPMRDGESFANFVTLGKNVKLDGVNPALLKNLKGMVQEYGETTGQKVPITSGARSTAEQEALYKKDPTTAAKPGRSLHEFGLALDVDSKTLDKMDEMGLMKKYGFTRPVGGEPWHMEPAGLQANPAAMKDDARMATTAIASSLFKGGGGLGSIPGSPKGKRDRDYALKLMEVDPEMKTSGEEKDLIAQGKTPSTPAPGKMSSGDKGSSLPSVPAAVSVKNGVQPTQQSVLSGGQGEESKPVSTASASGSTGDSDTKAKAMSGDKGAVKEEIKKAASKAGADPETLQTFGAIESGLNPNSKAKGTSASGAYGFLDGTWKAEVDKYGSKYGVTPDTPKTDITASTYMAAEYIKENEKAISKSVDNPGVADLYTAHFLGAGGANKLFRSNPSGKAADALPQAAASNPSIFYKNGYALTTEELYKNLANKVEKKAKEFGIPLKPDEISGNSSLAKGGNTSSQSSGSTSGNTSVPGTTTGKDSYPQQVASNTTQTPSAAPKVDKASSEAGGFMKVSNRSETPKPQAMPTPTPTPRVDSGQAMDGLTSKMSESVDYQKKQLDTLNGIFKYLKEDLPNLLKERTANSDSAPKSNGMVKTGAKPQQAPSFGLDTRRGFET